MTPVKIRDAQRTLQRAGATITSGGKHLKISHPAVPQTFHMPHRGRNGTATLSLGMTHEFHKFHALMLAAKSAA